VESCPHCHFLVHDDARTCGVCNRPLVLAAVDGSTAPIDAIRVGSGQASGVPIAVVVLTLLVLVFAAGAGLASAIWG
jgi:hypothetical protein